MTHAPPTPGELGIPPFLPPRWARGPHLQTVLGRYWQKHRLPATDRRVELKLSDGDRLSLLLRQAPSGSTRPDVVYLFHGLGGSTESDYIPRTAALLHAAGNHVIMANHRGCGPGAGLAASPYHSGRADDLSAVIAYGRGQFNAKEARHIAIGFSLSGNALLLLLGQHPEWPGPDFAISVNAPIDLARAADLLTQGFNRVYDLRFVQDARREIQARRQAGLLKPPIPGLEANIPRFATLKEVDRLYTAPFGGFRDREDYYARCSAAPHLDRIRVPTLALTAADDPFVDVRSYVHARTSPMVRVHIEECGGHMGFLEARPNAIGSPYWLDLALARYVEHFRVSNRTGT